MNMTKTSIKKVARTIGKSLTKDDLDQWISYSHKDGSEFYIVQCYYELIKAEGDEKGWLVIWTKTHGTVMYAEEDIIEWEGGEGDDEDEDDGLSSVILSD